MSAEVTARLRRLLAGDKAAACAGGLRASRTLLWRAFAIEPDNNDLAAEWMIDSGHLLWCWVLTCGTDRGEARRLTDHVRGGAADRLAETIQHDTLSWIATLRSAHGVSLVDEAIFTLSALTTGLGWDDPAVAACLATAHLRRFEHGRLPADLDCAIDLFRSVKDRIDDPPIVVTALQRLAQGLDTRHDVYGQPADAVEAASALRPALSKAAEEQRPAVAQKLAAMLLLTYQATGEESSLDEATALLDELVATTGATDPAAGRRWVNLGSARFLRYELRGDKDDLDGAIAAYREGAKTDGDDITMTNLGAALVKRFERTGVIADLEESLALLRSIVERTPENDTEYPMRLTNLSAALGHYSMHFGSSEALEEMVAVLRRAADAATDPTEKAWALHNLGNALGDRYEWYGHPADRDESVECFEQAVFGASDDPLSRPMYLMSLGRALNQRFEAFGNERDGIRAVSTLRSAINLLPVGSPERAMYLNVVAQALNDRFRHRHDPADVHEAVRYARAAVDITFPGDVDLSNHLNDLGIALHYRYEITNNATDLDQAIAKFHEAIECSTPAARARPAPYTNLAGALQDKFSLDGDLPTLDDAVTAFRSARRVAAPNDPNLPLYDSNIGEALTLRARRTGSRADASEAIAVLTRAVEGIGPNHPRLTVLRSNLASALAAEAALAGHYDTGDSSDLEDAIRHWHAAVDFSAAPAFERMRAALDWIRFTDKLGSVARSAAAHSAAVHVLPLLAWRGLDRGSQEHLLVGHRELARDAAACSVAAEQAATAVELLEAGRSVLWTQRLELRPDVARLAAHAGHLADRLAALRVRLDAPSGPATVDIEDRIAGSA